MPPPRSEIETFPLFKKFLIFVQNVDFIDYRYQKTKISTSIFYLERIVFKKYTKIFILTKINII